MDLKLTLERSVSGHPIVGKFKLKSASGAEKILDAVVTRFYKSPTASAGFIIYFNLDSSMN